MRSSAGPRQPGSRRDQVHLVTEARQSRSAEMSQRERRYFALMSIRVVCFILAFVLFLAHAGWVAMIPAIGSIVLPYFAVVVANARRQTGIGGFRPYRPPLPERYVPGEGERQPGSGDPGQS